MRRMIGAVKSALNVKFGYGGGVTTFWYLYHHI